MGLGAAVGAGCRWPFVYDDRALMRATELANLLEEHVGRYPRMAPADVYKLCHQRRMGPGHLVAAGDARSWLKREAAELGPLPPGVEDMDVEVLDRYRGLARVHLRPWLAPGRSPEALADAFAETAARWTPEPERLAEELGWVPGVLGQVEGWAGFDQAAWEAFTGPLVEQGLPAVHHSEGYRAAYAPAYRVVLVELLG